MAKADRGDQLDKEIAAYDQMRHELERQHNGKFVIIHGGKLINAFDSVENAAEFARKNLHTAPFLLRQVGAPPRTIPTSVFTRAFEPA